MRTKRLLIIQLLLIISFTSFAQELPRLIPYRKGNKFGYVDQNKKVVIPFKYNDAGVFCDGFAWVKRRNRYTYINEQGKKLTRFKFTAARDFDDYQATVRVFRRWKHINKEGRLSRIRREIIGVCAHYFYKYKSDKAVWYFMKNGKYGVVKECNVLLIGCDTLVAPKYDSAYINDGDGDGFVHVSTDHKWGIVYWDKEIVSPKYDWIGLFSYGSDKSYSFSYATAQVLLNKKLGFIGQSGEEINKPEYEEASDFKGGLARVILNKKPGYIDLKGNKYFEE